MNRCLAVGTEYEEVEIAGYSGFVLAKIDVDADGSGGGAPLVDDADGSGSLASEAEANGIAASELYARVHVLRWKARVHHWTHHSATT